MPAAVTRAKEGKEEKEEEGYGEEMDDEELYEEFSAAPVSSNPYSPPGLVFTDGTALPLINRIHKDIYSIKFNLFPTTTHARVLFSLFAVHCRWHENDYILRKRARA